MTTQSPKLGDTIQKLRAVAGFSQKEFAERLGVDPSYVSRLESGDREPSLELLRKMARELDLPPGLLLAVALWTEMPSNERSRYEKIINSLVELAGLYQLRLPIEEAPDS